MNLLRSFRVLTFVLVLLSIVGLCMAQHSLQLLLWAGTLAAMSWYFTEGPRVLTIPRWISNLLVIAASLWVFVDLFQHTGDVMRVLGRFAVWLTLIKLYERRTARDHAHLLMLSLLLMMTGCLQSDDLFFGIILILYSALGLYVLLLYQLYASFEQARNERQALIPKDYRLVPPLKPIIGRNAGVQFRAHAIAIAALGAVLSASVFVAYPREIGMNMLGLIRPPFAGRVTQFAWGIDLNAGGRINESRVRALSVQLLSDHGQPIRQDEPLLLRGAVLDRYIGAGRWKSSNEGSAPSVFETQSDKWTPVTGRDRQADGNLTQRITVYRATQGVAPIFSIYAPVAVRCETPVTMIYDRDKQTLRTDESSRRVLSYSVKASTFGPLPSGQRPDQPNFVEWFPPNQHRQLRDLARSILLRSKVRVGRPEAENEVAAWKRSAVEALTRHLQSDGAFTYTTDLRNVVYSSREQDPIIEFLSNHKKGHCEFFASGLAAMCHSIGIPARVAVGYIAYQYDEAAQEYVVLEANAHAWAEVALDDQGWTTFDPTPAGSVVLAQEAEDNFANTVREIYSAFDGDWSNNIMAFDSITQTKLADSFHKSWSSRIANALGAVREWMDQVNRFFNVGPGGYIWMATVALALVIAIIALMKLMNRTRAIRRTLQLKSVGGSEHHRMLRQLGFYFDMLTVLHRGGKPKPHWQPPASFASSLTKNDPVTSELVRRLTELFYAGRYGNRELQPSQIEEARFLLQDLAATLKVKA
jgi:protein-glutamine gamma-glutamyltransferase